MSINPDEVRIGNSPNSMEGDRQVFGRVYIGTNGRGVFFGEPAARLAVVAAGILLLFR